MTNGVEFAMTGHISPDLFVYLNQSVLSALTWQNCGGGTGLSSAFLPSSPFSSLSRQQGSPAASAHSPHLFPSGVITMCHYLMGYLLIFHVSSPTGLYTPKRAMSPCLKQYLVHSMCSINICSRIQPTNSLTLGQLGLTMFPPMV